MEIGILFADIRGFTAWSEKNTPSAVTERLARFYEQAGRVLTRDDALVEYVGDQVMALYLPDFPSLRERTAEVMVAAAGRLLSEVEAARAGDDALRVGVGVHIGLASVGNVGKGGTKDFTAIGDAVNTAARLQSCAGPDQIVVSDVAFERMPAPGPEAAPASFEVKGKSEALRAHVIERPALPPA